jgi:hypothetical protein
MRWNIDTNMDIQDACNSITAVQTITVQPAPPPVFDPVTDQTITCAQADVFAPTNLNYTNGEPVVALSPDSAWSGDRDI